MKQTLQLKLSQHLTLTPQLQQSIRLLQLSTIELNAEVERMLQEKFAIVGFALPDSQHPDYPDFVRSALTEFIAENERHACALDDFVALTSFIPASFTDEEGYTKLAEELARVEKERGTFGNRLYYMATPPSLVADILQRLKEHQLTTHSPVDVRASGSVSTPLVAPLAGRSGPRRSGAAHGAVSCGRSAMPGWCCCGRSSRSQRQ